MSGFVSAWQVLTSRTLHYAKNLYFSPSHSQSISTMWLRGAGAKCHISTFADSTRGRIVSAQNDIRGFENTGKLSELVLRQHVE